MRAEGRLLKILCTAWLLATVLPAFALKSDNDQPVNIESDEQFADLQANKAVFTGSVHGTQGSIVLNCDKAELFRDSEGRLKEVHTYGNPVTFRQLLDNGKVIRSQSSILEYFPQKQLVVLTGRATIWQDESHVNGERIEYNLATERIKATNPNRQGGRVHSPFMPAEFGKDSNRKPAPGNAADAPGTAAASPASPAAPAAPAADASSASPAAPSTPPKSGNRAHAAGN